MDYPAHYSADDIRRIEVIRAWIDERAYTQAALARLARVSGSTLNQIINASYATSPGKILLTIEAAMRHADETSGELIPPVETSVYRLTHMACNMARKYRNFAVLSGHVGTGKTFALKEYAKANPNTHIVEASPTMTPSSLVKRLARMICGLEKGSIADKFDEIIATLKNTNSLLVIDEAETLTPAQLHTIRRIRDMAHIGVVLAGTEHLAGIIKPAHGQFDQIRSRTGFWPETIRAISAEDAAALAQSAFGAEEVPDDVLARLYAYCQGSARMLVEGLVAGIRQFRGERPLDVKLVDAVAKQALCLQSLA